MRCGLPQRRHRYPGMDLGAIQRHGRRHRYRSSRVPGGCAVTAQAKTPIEVLKALRELHAASFARTQEILKSQKQTQQAITKSLKEQTKTVPDLATATG